MEPVKLLTIVQIVNQMGEGSRGYGWGNSLPNPLQLEVEFCCGPFTHSSLGLRQPFPSKEQNNNFNHQWENKCKDILMFLLIFVQKNQPKIIPTEMLLIR